MKKDDLKQLQDMINEEGMRRDIGRMIEESAAYTSAGNKAFSSKIIIGSFVLVIIAALSWLYYTRLNKRNLKKVEEINTTEKVKSNLDASANSDKDSLFETQKINRAKQSLVSQGNFKERLTMGSKKTALQQDGTNGLHANSSMEYPDDPGGTNFAPVSNITNTSTDHSNKVGFGNSSNGVLNPTIKDASDNKNVATGTDTSASINAEKNSNTFAQPEDSTNLNVRKTIDTSQVASTDSLKTGMNDSLNNDNDNANKKYANRKMDAMFGMGYGFLGTGDLGVIVFNNAFNYRFNNRLAASINGSFGQGQRTLQSASYFQGSIDAFVSPFGNSRKNDFRIGAGFTTYRISHSYRGSSRLVGGVLVYDYIFENRSATGLSLSLENRYSISDKVLVGLRLYSQQYIGGDAVTGASIMAGIKF